MKEKRRLPGTIVAGGKTGLLVDFSQLASYTGTLQPGISH
jgi:hypothetical protein